MTAYTVDIESIPDDAGVEIMAGDTHPRDLLNAQTVPTLTKWANDAGIDVPKTKAAIVGALAGHKGVVDRARQAQRDAEREKAALHPISGRVACVGIWGEDDDLPVMGMASAEEKALLEQASDLLHGASRIYTFNGSFDVWMLAARMMRHGVRVPPVLHPESRYGLTYKKHIDLRDILTNFDNRARGTLTQWARALGVDPLPIDHGPGQIADWMMEQKYQRVEEVCLRDVAATRQIADRAVSSGMVPPVRTR